MADAVNILKHSSNQTIMQSFNDEPLGGGGVGCAEGEEVSASCSLYLWGLIVV